jgi:hypothetical protein
MTDPKTDHNELAPAFEAWVNRALAQDIPEDVRALCINLYETGDAFGLEMIGAPRFDSADADWACDEVFAYREDPLEIPAGRFDGKWDRCLAACTELLQGYLRSGAEAHRLESYDAVAIGFVDGDLEVVWKRE